MGFAFLGASYVISALAYTELYHFSDFLWTQLLVRTFAFVFLAVTYYFSKKPSKNTRQLWDITLSVLIVCLFALFLVTFIFPQVASDTYIASQVYIRVFIIICLSYIVVHTLRSHIKNPDPTTIWVPMGFILLAISQYSLLFCIFTIVCCLYRFSDTSFDGVIRFSCSHLYFVQRELKGR